MVEGDEEGIPGSKAAGSQPQNTSGTTQMRR